MPSPFPGMDPYLEKPGLWSEFHLALILAMRDALNASLPEQFAASADRHVWIEDEEEPILRSPDVFITEEEDQGPFGSGRGPGVLQVAPKTVNVTRRSRKGSPFLRIEDSEEKRVITVVELLSPANKTKGPNREGYLAKREEYLESDVNLIEIDLLRAGERLKIGRIPPAADYYMLVCPVATAPKSSLWTFSVRDLVPDLPVPLTQNFPSTLLSMRPCLDRAYDGGRCQRKINYSLPPEPPLPEPNATWAKELLARQG